MTVGLLLPVTFEQKVFKGQSTKPAPAEEKKSSF